MIPGVNVGNSLHIRQHCFLTGSLNLLGLQVSPNIKEDERGKLPINNFQSLLRISILDFLKLDDGLAVLYRLKL